MSDIFARNALLQKGWADTMLDAPVFSGYRLPIERVMVHGNWCVIDGDHIARQENRAGFAAALQRLGVGQ